MRYAIWCQAHIDTLGDYASPRYETNNRAEATRLRKQAAAECQADPPSRHFIEDRGPNP